LHAKALILALFARDFTLADVPCRTNKRKAAYKILILQEQIIRQQTKYGKDTIFNAIFETMNSSNLSYFSFFSGQFEQPWIRVNHVFLRPVAAHREP
jgi:hypothetical protein